MNKYRQLEKEIVADLMDLSRKYGPVEVRLTEETEEGSFIPCITVTKAPDGVLRGLAEDDRIAALTMENGELHILPAPEWLDGLHEGDREEREPMTWGKMARMVADAIRQQGRPMDLEDLGDPEEE